MLIHSAVITGSVQLNNTDVSSITNVAGFATTASVNELQSKTGSYATTSSVNNLQSVTGSYATTSSFGAYTSSNDTTNTTQNTRLSTIESVTGSYATTSSVNNLQSVTGSYATTGSNQFNGNQSISGSITSNGTITAQTLVVQTVTSSIEFVTGSTRNGSLSSNTHQFTGSVLMTGSLSVTGSAAFSSDVTTGGKILISDGGNATIPCLKIGSATTGISQNVSEQLNFITNSTTKMVISSSGNIGIGTTTPQSLSTNTFKFIDISNIGSSQTAGLTMHAQTGGQEFSIHHTNGVYIDVVGHSTATNNFIQFRVASANSTYTSYVDAMRITSAGNVGIGTTSPVSNDSDSRTFQLGNRLVVQNVIGTQFLIGTNAYYDGTWKYIAAAKYQAIRGTGESGHISFHLASAGTAGGTITNMDGSDIKMIIKESGNVGIGTTSPSTLLHIKSGTAQTDTFGYLQLEYTTAAAGNAGLTTKNTFGTGQFMQWENYGLRIGSRILTSTGQGGITFTYGSDYVAMTISSNGSIGAPTGTNIYNASDIRLKKNISTTTYGLDTISALNPVKFNWVDGFELTEDGKDLLGFIAQEVQQVIPEAVEGFGGNSITIADTIIDNPLRVNEKFIIPVLVKAIQEQQAQIEELKTLIKQQ